MSLPGQTGSVTQVAAGNAYSLALTSSGQLYAFGYNGFGQLGNATNNGTTNPNATPTLVSLPGQTGTITQIAAGYNHSLVLTSTGQLYAFGYNQYGQLGNATNNGTANPNPTPTLVSLPGQTGTITQIAAGEYDSMALTSTGQLYAFGDNAYGELGNATNNGTGVANPTPTPVSLPGQSGTITQIAAGAVHNLALTSSGQLYAFGYNQYGQLGNATNSGTGTANPTPTAVSLPGQSGAITQIGAESNDSLAVTSSGQLYAFGLNRYGQLGNTTNNGTNNANPAPTRVSLPTGTTIDAVARGSGSLHTLALTAPGSAIPTSKPVVSSVSQARSRWRLGNRLATISKKQNKPPVGTTFTFTLNEAAQVTLTFTHPAAGRKVNGRCVAPTKANRSRRPCRRQVTDGTLKFTGHQGQDKVLFQGRLTRSRRLRPGSYTVTITATTGGQSSTAQKLSFTIVKG